MRNKHKTVYLSDRITTPGVCLFTLQSGEFYGGQKEEQSPYSWAFTRRYIEGMMKVIVVNRGGVAIVSYRRRLTFVK